MLLNFSRHVLAVEIVGTLFIIFLGSFLHFTFDLSGGNPAVGWFSATTESVWEHLKLAFWPSLLWMLLIIAPLRRQVNNFFLAKTVGACFMITFIPIFFYSYTAIVEDNPIIDIGSFAVAVILGQIISYRLFKARRFPSWAEKLSIAVMILLAIVFVVFTFYPPHLPIFRDPINGGYGI